MWVNWFFCAVHSFDSLEEDWREKHGSPAMFKETCIVNTLDLLSVPGEHIQSLPLSLPLEDTLIADPRRHLAELAEKEKVKNTFLI